MFWVILTTESVVVTDSTLVPEVVLLERIVSS